jgi:hypothetical protein
MTYSQSTGELKAADGTLLGRGFSGIGAGLNQPTMQGVYNVGPLPVGFYRIDPPANNTLLGPFVIPLDPNPSNKMYGRKGFYMHGECVQHPLQSSHGCIVMGLTTREAAWLSGDRVIEVVA